MALDGPCDRLDVMTIADATVIAIAEKHLLRVTSSGLQALDAADLAKVSKHEDGDQDAITAAGGRSDDLWVQTMSPGSVMRESRIYRRRDGHWSEAAPLGHEKQHYAVPESWRGGAVAVVTPLIDYDRYDSRRVIAFELPREVAPSRIFPPSVRVEQLHALSSGELVARTTRVDDAGSGNTAFFLAAPDATRAKELKWGGTRFSAFEGRTRATLRVIEDEKKRYRLEGDELVREELENAPEWRQNGPAIQHLVGAGYHDVVLPRLPISGATPKVDSLALGHDGEAFVEASWVDRYSGRAFRALLRSRRPSEVLRCAEKGSDDAGSAVWRPATASGIEPSPPRADESCPTPFVVAARLREGRTPRDLGPTRAALAKAGFDVAVEVIASGTRKVTGARAPSFAAATAMAAALQKTGLAPEVVCADPERVDAPADAGQAPARAP